MTDPRHLITDALATLADVDTRALPDYARTTLYEAAAALREARAMLTPEHLLTPTR